MKTLFSCLAIVLLAACAQPHYTYHFDKHNYNAGLKAQSKEALSEPEPLQALTASVAKKTAVVASPALLTPLVPVKESKVLEKPGATTTRKELRQNLKETIREYKQVIKQQSAAEKPTAREGKTSGMAIAGFVCGVMAPIAYILFLPLAILAVVFSAIGLKQTRRNPELRGRGLAIAGLVLGILELTALLIVVLLIVSLFASGWE